MICYLKWGPNLLLLRLERVQICSDMAFVKTGLLTTNSFFKMSFNLLNIQIPCSLEPSDTLVFLFWFSKFSKITFTFPFTQIELDILP